MVLFCLLKVIIVYLWTNKGRHLMLSGYTRRDHVIHPSKECLPTPMRYLEASPQGYVKIFTGLRVHETGFRELPSRCALIILFYTYLSNILLTAIFIQSNRAYRIRSVSLNVLQCGSTHTFAYFYSLHTCELQHMCGDQKIPVGDGWFYWTMWVSGSRLKLSASVSWLNHLASPNLITI